MCGDPPSPPSGSLPDGATTGPVSGTGLCCACPANGVVNTNGFGNYFTATYFQPSTIINKCRINVVRTEEGGTVTITKTFSLAYSNGASQTAHMATVTGAITGAMSTWQSEAANFRLVIEQPGCKLQKLKIQYTSTIATSGADVAITVNGTPAPPPKSRLPQLRSAVTGGTKMKFFLNGVGSVNWTMIHEIGHTFGLPDEYVLGHPVKAAPSVTYKGATQPAKSVTFGPSLASPNPPTAFAFDNASVMGKSGNTIYPDYLFYWVAIEVQNILKAAGVSANVKIEPA